MFSYNTHRVYFGPTYVSILFPAVVLVVLGVVSFSLGISSGNATNDKTTPRITKTTAGKKIKQIFDPKYFLTEDCLTHCTD